MKMISSQIKNKGESSFLNLVDINVTNIKTSYRNISLELQIFRTKSVRKKSSAELSGDTNHNDRNSGLKTAKIFP